MANAEIRTDLKPPATYQARLEKRAFVSVRAATFEVIADVKTDMPVDTGRARADWGSDPDFNEDDLESEHGSTLVYVPRLNEGHSSQAPAGFIDAIAERAAGDLAEKLLDDMEREV